MALPVVGGATISCSFGLGPGVLMATAQTAVLMGGAPAATIRDAVPRVNVGPCGLCASMSCPATAAATAAALGVLTPTPCNPAPVGNWSATSGPSIGGVPGLMSDAILVCAYGGTIRITVPGQNTVLG